jgi:hypothetical protein
MKEKINKLLIFAVLFLVYCFNACKDKKLIEAERMVKEWVGKTVKFPENPECFILGRDTISDVCADLFQKDYKILFYIDSTGCSGCRLKLSEMKQLITETDTMFHGQLGILIFFQPKSKKEMKFLLKEAKFDYPVFIDMNNVVNKLNHFPNQEIYQSFLLDRDNKVLKIGNPILNIGIKRLYVAHILGNKTSQQQNLTSVEVDKTKHDFGNIMVEESNEVVFQLKNTGTYPLTIHNVSASCGCTTVEWDKQPAKQRESVQIRMKIKPDEEGYFDKTIDVYCNTEKSPIKLIISGTANKQIKITQKKKEVVKKTRVI